MRIQNQIEHFYVIIHDFNTNKMVPYDVLPCLVDRCRSIKPKPRTFEEVRDLVRKESMYRWWAKCQYEILLSPWSSSTDKESEKWDVHQQVMMNLDLVAHLVMKSLKLE